MPKWLKNMFSTPSVHTLQITELDNAERELLKAKTARDYAESIVAYNEVRIQRLRKALDCKEKLHEIAG